MADLNLILLGPPGSGKGTQGERLQEDLDLPYYATGDILRAAVKEGTDVGTKAKEYMDRGDLVPDEVLIGIIAERLESGDRAFGGGKIARDNSKSVFTLKTRSGTCWLGGSCTCV